MGNFTFTFGRPSVKILRWYRNACAVPGTTRCIPKVRELGIKLSHFTIEWKVQSKLFKVHPSSSNTRVEMINEFFETFFILIWRNFARNARYVLLNTRNVIKKVSFQLQFEFWEQKIISRGQIRRIRRMVDDLNWFCGKKIADFDAVVRGCIIMEELPAALFSVLRTNPSNSRDQTLHYGKV